MNTTSGESAPNDALRSSDETSFLLRRLRFRYSSPFAEIVSRLESAVRRFDPDQKPASSDGPDSIADIRANIQAQATPSGFVLLAKIDHQLLEHLGRKGKSIQYAIGNPLVAAELTIATSGAALYAPFRLAVIKEAFGDATTILCDDPADLMGSFGNAEAAKIGLELSSKLRKLLETL
ncbi:DUF302 domain-containing protein [Sphingomonas kyeonggiensis]|uniref:Uncharacterized protein (DUF302 family) n=1 Tax=Sphingomonas kyeonggiensis TaxID=1268553 RepID=A0A7W6JT61_9SPHN|nr:DUF302 domain-containing protein [Sphingomonas kyeonggiensis]MBB4097970.1 uncharacterized protein (DUF302 family) [Sphingomonas kyeonggiensis]